MHNTIELISYLSLPHSELSLKKKRKEKKRYHFRLMPVKLTINKPFSFFFSLSDTNSYNACETSILTAVTSDVKF